MKSASRLRAGLVEELRVRGVLRSEAVASAFATVPRDQFIPDVRAQEGLETVYRDRAFVTKRDPQGMPLSSSSQPALMATMLELLDVRSGQRVLEIGTGTGYNAALLSHLVGREGEVISVDVDRELAFRAKRALKQAGYRASVVVGDGRRGWLECAPYDRIVVTACADRIPRAWLEQLGDGGLLELPLELDPDRAAIQVIPLFRRKGDRLNSTALTWGGFMALHDGTGQWSLPPASLTASRSGGKGHSSLVSLSGLALSALPDARASELLALTLSERGRPRAGGVIAMDSAHPPMLLIYLLHKVPPGKRLVVRKDDRLGVGLLHRRSRSLAFVSVRSPWRDRCGRQTPRVRWRLDAYGGTGAAAELERLLAEWEALTQSGRDNLRITAKGAGDPLRLSFGWGRRRSAPSAASDP